MGTSLQMNVVWVVCLLVAVAAPPASAVVTTIQPGTFGGNYYLDWPGHGAPLWGVSGVQTPDLVLGEQYLIGIPWAQPGMFKVTDAGGGNYDVNITAGQGLSGTTGTPSPTVNFVNKTVKFNASNYVGVYHGDWAFPNNNEGNTQYDLPVANGYFAAWSVFGLGNTINFNVAADGSVAVTAQQASGLPMTGFTAAGNEIQFPTCQDISFQGISPDPGTTGFNWWKLDWGLKNNRSPFVDETLALLPGTYRFYGHLNEYFTADFDIPQDATGWSQVIQRTGADGVVYEFVFTGPEAEPYIPEPATMALFGIGGIGLLLRRRRSSQIKKERRIMLKATKSLTVVAALGLFVLAAAPALGVTLTVDPNGYGQPGYGDPHATVAGQTVKGTSPVNLTVSTGTWYNVHIQPATVGEFQIVDLGGGIYDVETRTSGGDPTPPAGLTGTMGTGSPSLTYNNLPVNIDRGPDWQGAWTVNWASKRTSANGSVNMPILPAGQNYQGWVADSTLRGGFWFNLASDGTVTPTNTDPAGLAYTGGMNLLTMPGTQEFTWTRSGGPTPDNWNWWQLDSTGVGSGKPFLESGVAYLLPNGTQGYNFIGDLGGAAWPGQLSVPMDATGWSQSLTVYDDQGNPYTWTFSGPEAEPYIPEPATMALLGIGGIGLLIRRRK